MADPASAPAPEPHVLGTRAGDADLEQQNGDKDDRERQKDDKDGDPEDRTDPMKTLQIQPSRMNVTCRRRARRFLLSVEFQVFMTFVILVDVAVFIVDEVQIYMSNPKEEEQLWPFYVSVVTLALYVMEIVAKFICIGCYGFFRDWWNSFDLILVLGSAVLIGGPGEILIAGRLGKVVRYMRCLAKISRLCLRARPISQAARARVSKNKRRYVEKDNNLDLDLTYIRDHLIAMGVPTTGWINPFFRNPLRDVARFFKLHHKGHFKVYNLCPEMPYPDDLFEKYGGSVYRFEIQDHSPPCMEHFVQFLSDAHAFRKDNSRNVLAVHCKAGKGRTGSFCCAWLLYAQIELTVESALGLFAERRTDESKLGKLRGVETPSQIRYITQLYRHLERTDSWKAATEDTTQGPAPVPAPEVKLSSLCLEGGFFAHPEKLKGVRVLVQCFDGSTVLPEPVLETVRLDPSSNVLPLADSTVKGDVRVALFHDTGKGFSARGAMLASPENFHKAKGLLAYFWIHTGFLYRDEEDTSAETSLDPSGSFSLDVGQVDKASKKIKSSNRPKGRFGEGSRLVLHFSGGREAAATAAASGSPRQARQA